jgi:hypothetical protein
MTGVAVGVAFEVVLMIRFCLPERPHWLQFGDDFPRPDPAGLYVGGGIQCGAFLPLVFVIDGRAIRCPAVIALTV